MALIKPPPKKPPGGQATPSSTPQRQPTPGQPGKPAPAGAPRPGQPSANSQNIGKKSVMVGAGKVTLSSGTKVKAGGGAMAMLKGEAKPQSRGIADEKIEEKVFALPGIKEYEDVQLFTDFVEKMGPKLKLPNTSRGILEAFSNIDVTAEKVSQCLKANPYYEAQFLQQIDALGKRSETPSLEGAVVLLGMQNSRNLIIALQLTRTMMGGHPEWTKEGKLKLAPNDVLKYALKTEEALQGNKSGYADTAYVAGLLFDYMNWIAGQQAEDKKKVQAYIETIYNHGLRSAQIAIEIAKDVPDFGFKKYLFSACLVHDIGKVVMAILEPKYLAFVDDLLKRELPRALRFFVEQRKFKINHAVLGAATCHYFQIFKIIEKAILFHHEPFLLRSRNKNLFQLASIVCLASNMANNFRKPDKADDPVFAIWKGHELKDFNINVRTLTNAISKLS